MDNPKQMLAGLLMMIRQAIVLSEQHGTKEEHEHAKVAGEYICKAMRSGNPDDTCHEYLDHLQNLCEKYKEGAPEEEHTIVLTYKESKQGDVPDGFCTGSAEMNMSEGAGPRQLVNMFLALRVKLERDHPEMLPHAMAEMRELPGTEDGAITSLAQLKEIILKHVRRCKETHKDVKHEELAAIWERAVTAYDNIKEPDDLDGSILRTISNTIEELGDNPTKEQIEATGMDSLLKILEKNN